MRKKFDYGVIFITRLKEAPGEFVDVRTIARRHGLPVAFLEKVAQELKRAGWIESRRGLGGGYRLIKDPNEVGITELINLFAPPLRFCPASRFFTLPRK